MIKAPYNFVPLYKDVFFPNWANEISQDIPFSDGISGSIKLKITAETPIFVRNGHTREDADEKNDNYKSFSKTDDGQFFIPATSIKGCIRNVLEIMSFGKMTQVQNESFGIRDLSKSADGDFYTKKIVSDKVHCGWLWQENDNYYIDDCGLPWRISAEELDRKLGCGLENFDKKGNFKDDYNRTASKKYELFSGMNLVGTFSPDEELRNSHKVGNRQFVYFDNDGDEGTIVFTGQPGVREQSSKINKKGKRIWIGKYFEFVFPSKIIISKIKIDKSIINEFISIHKDSPDYKNFRKDQLNNSIKIPIFFIYNDDEIDSIGLSYMYKYPAYNSIYNAMRKCDFDCLKMDLAECIFGIENNEHSLKGRVQFGPAFVDRIVEEIGENNIVLSSPHPSYYPLYLGNGKSWNSDNAQIAGWKRYPVRIKLMESTKGTTDMVTIIKPLPANTIFIEKLYFHNLREVELGALLSAILFHGEENCFHNIGSAKSLGYGKMKVDIESLCTADSNKQIKFYLDCFENEMNKYISSWRESEPIKELLSMAKGIPIGKESDFKYMHMDLDRSKNEFIKGRDLYATGIQLGTFSQILANNVPKSNFVGNVSASKQRQHIEKELERKKEKEERYKIQLLLGKELFERGNVKMAKEEFTKAKEYSVSTKDIDDYLKKIEDAEEIKKNNVNSIINKANELFREKKYEEAKAKFIEAGNYSVIDVKYKIAECDTAISKLETLSHAKIEDIITCSSLGALAGSLKKWISIRGNLNEDDCQCLGNKLKIEIAKLNKNKQNEWKEWKKWKVIIDLIGEECANRIYKLV